MAPSLVTLTDLCFELAELYEPEKAEAPLSKWTWPATFGRYLRDRQDAGRSPFVKDANDTTEHFISSLERKLFFSFTVAMSPNVKRKCQDHVEEFRGVVACMMARYVLERYLYTASADALIGAKLSVDDTLSRTGCASAEDLAAVLKRLPATADDLLVLLKMVMHGEESPLNSETFDNTQIAEVFHNKFIGQAALLVRDKVKATPELEEALDRVNPGANLTGEKLVEKREKVPERPAPGESQIPHAADVDPLEKWRKLPSYTAEQVRIPQGVDWNLFEESAVVKGGSGGIDLHSVAGRVVVTKWVKDANAELYPVRLAHALNLNAVGDRDFSGVRLANARLVGTRHDDPELQKMTCAMYDVASGNPVGTTAHLDLQSMPTVPDGMTTDDVHGVGGGIRSKKDQNGKWVVDPQLQSPQWKAFVVRSTVVWKLSTSKLLLMECISGMQQMQGLGGFHKVPVERHPSCLAALGRLCAFDVLVNNVDRLPFKLIWGNEGNFQNIMIDQRPILPAGLDPASVNWEIVGIDTQVWPITNSLGKETYRGKITQLCQRLAKWPGDTSEDDSAWAKNLREGIFGATGVDIASVKPFLEGMRAVLGGIAMDLSGGESNVDALLDTVEHDEEAPEEAQVREFVRGNILAVLEGFKG